MAYGDLQIFNDFMYRAFDVTYQQDVEKFNGATNNALILTSDTWAGDYMDEAALEDIGSLIVNRDPSASTAATDHALSELLSAKVKVGWGTPNITYTDTSFDWTSRDPAEAGARFGEGLARGAMGYQLNSAIAALVAFLDDSDVTYDGTAGTASIASLNKGAALFGDRQSNIAAWIMHSKSVNDIYGEAIANSNDLHDFGTIKVTTDGFGRPLVMTDSSHLFFDNSGTDNYHQLGLVQGACVVEAQGQPRVYDDLDLSEVNAKKKMKAEGAFGLQIKGAKWNTSVTKPNDAALALASNWSRITDLGLKDTAGVKVTTL